MRLRNISTMFGVRLLLLALVRRASIARWRTRARWVEPHQPALGRL